nr:MAG: glycoprotein [Rhabdoviridae sp.]
MLLILLVVSCVLANQRNYQHFENPLHDQRSALVPLNPPVKWLPASLDSLRCPTHTELGPDAGHTLERWLIKRPHNPKVPKVDGHLCHIAKWITRCEFTWYFSKTISRKIEPLDVSQAQCSDATRAYKSGSLTPGSFPPEVCSWAHTNDETLTAVTITPHQVTYDPYKNVYLDHLFAGGTCSDSYCPTVYQSTAWLATSGGTPTYCDFPGEEPVELVLGYKDTVGRRFHESFWLRGPHLSHEPFHMLCKKGFCGHEGFMTDKGFWFFIEDVVWQYNKSVLFMTDIRPCATEEPIKVSDDFPDPSEIRATISELMWDLNCFNTLENIVHHNKISLHDIFQISPQEPGPGMIYRVKDGSLEAAMVQLVRVILETKPRRECIGKYHTKAQELCLGWSDWLLIGNRTYQGYNGITEVDGQLIFPPMRVIGRRWDEEYIAEHHLHKVTHPVLGNLSWKIHENLHHVDIKHLPSNVGDLMGGWVVSAEHKVGAFFRTVGGTFMSFGVILAFGIIVYLFIQLCKLLRRRNTTRPKKEELEFKAATAFGA